MPNRVIREEINSSRSLSRVSLYADLTFRALIVAVDDYGRYEADPLMLKAKLFPRRLEVTPEMVGGWVAELDADGCVKVYEVGGSAYLQLTGWEKQRWQGKRAGRSRYPEAPVGNPTPPEDFHGKSRESSGENTCQSGASSKDGNFSQSVEILGHPRISTENVPNANANANANTNANTNARTTGKNRERSDSRQPEQPAASPPTSATNPDPIPDLISANEIAQLAEQLSEHAYLGRMLDMRVTLHALRTGFPELNLTQTIYRAISALDDAKIAEQIKRGRPPNKYLTSWFEIADRERRMEAQNGNGKAGNGGSGRPGRDSRERGVEGAASSAGDSGADRYASTEAFAERKRAARAG